MTKLMGLVVVPLWSAACTQRHAVTTLHPREPAAEVEGETIDGEQVTLRAVETHEGLRWEMRREEPGLPMTRLILDDRELVHYKNVNRWRGAWQGARLGALGGAATGVVIGFMSDPAPNCWILCSRGHAAIALGTVLAMLGVGTGLMVGTLIGSRDLYQVKAPHAPKLGANIGPDGASAQLGWTF